MGTELLQLPIGPGKGNDLRAVYEGDDSFGLVVVFDELGRNVFEQNVQERSLQVRHGETPDSDDGVGVLDGVAGDEVSESHRLRRSNGSGEKIFLGSGNGVLANLLERLPLPIDLSRIHLVEHRN